MAGPKIETEIEPERQTVVREAVEALRNGFDSGKQDNPRNVLTEYPNTARIVNSLRCLIDILFPGKGLGDVPFDGRVPEFLERALVNVWDTLLPEIERAIPFRWLGEAARVEGNVQQCEPKAEAGRIVATLFRSLPEVRQMLVDDVRAAYEGDPAALTFAEVKLAYPGIIAITSHRIAHELYKLAVPIVPRVMSEWTHTQTGADIHPGARIGKGFFIDHPTGVVIGETARLGNRVKLYGGVTLGAKSFPLDENGRPIKYIQRHPTLEDNVTIYSNATILGGDTVIGAGATVGGNVFLLSSVPAGATVVYQAGEYRIK